MRRVKPESAKRAFHSRRLSTKSKTQRMRAFVSTNRSTNQEPESNAAAAIACNCHAQITEDIKNDDDFRKNLRVEVNSNTEIDSEDLVEANPAINRCQDADVSNDSAAHVEGQKIEGRRIVDVSYLLEQIRELDNHNARKGCFFKDMFETHFRQLGLQTTIFVECRRCNYRDSIFTDRTEGDTMTINRCAVTGSIATGIGHSQLKELLASIAIPCMSAPTFRKNEMEVVSAFEKAAYDEMLKSGEAAKESALAKGHFIVHEGEKVPYVTVVADCAWMKRSYRTGKYDSLSGIGAIVEAHTGKVLFIGVRNKFCFVCERAARYNEIPRRHRCFKNWGRDQASTGMEPDALLDGFQTSIETHGLIYKTLIADGDSSVYKTILDNDPYRIYGVVVDKKECKNHLLRNFCGKVKATSNTKGRNISHLKKTVGSSVLKFRESIEMITAYRRGQVDNGSTLQSQIDLLKRDVLNVPFHVFGDHRRCHELRGPCIEVTTNEGLRLVDDLKKSGFFQQLEDAIMRLAYHSESLIYNANNNAAEAFNSIVCKTIGGKRINFGMRGSFQARCAGSVLQFHTQNMLTKLHESEGKKPPVTVTSLEDRRQRKVANDARNRHERRLLRKLDNQQRRKQGRRDENYGPNAAKPDLSPPAFDDAVTLHWERLLEQQQNRVEIEENSRGQADNGLWRSLRSKMLTASNFGKVCRMRDTTSCAVYVKSILYPSVKGTPAMIWGTTNESKAIEALEEKLAEEGNAVKIERCGLFIDRELPYLGASPDGIIDDKTIVEVKCPQSVQEYDPEVAVQQRVAGLHKLFDAKDPNKMSKSHQYYYQVQGQLHITQADFCYFAVWTPKNLKYVRFPRDDHFWKTQIEPHLMRFYNQCLLPEIVDGRYPRNMPIREPEYILEARQLKIKAAEASDATMRARNKVIVTPEFADVSTDLASLTQTPSVDSERESINRTGTRKTVPIKLFKSDPRDDHSWRVDSSDDNSNVSQSSVPPLKLYKRKTENGVLWSLSSSDEQCSLKGELRVPPLKLQKRTTELGDTWVSLSSEEHESESRLQSVFRSPTAPRIISDVPVKLVRTNNKRASAAALSTSQKTNQPWVVLPYDRTAVPTEIEMEILESLNRGASIAEVRTDILCKDSFLTDASIDQFLFVIKDTTDFDTATTQWLALPGYIRLSWKLRDIHIIGGNSFRHWRCTHYDGTRLFVYDSLGCSNFQLLTEEERQFISIRYPNLNTNDVVFPATQKQPDGTSCGVFAAAFATTVALGENPSNTKYSLDVMKLRNHLLHIIQSRKLTPFPSV